MNSTKKVFGVHGIWVPLTVMLIALGLSFTDWVPFGDERAEKKERIDNLEETKNRLPAMASSMKKSEMEEAKPKEELKPTDASPSAESAIKLESMSDEEYQDVVLEHAPKKERQNIANQFKWNNEFKASLSQTQKKEFDDDVNKAYAKLRVSSGVQEDDLTSFHKQTLRRCAESMIVTDWRVKDLIDRQDAQTLRYLERQEEENRLWNEEFLAKLVERFGPEVLDQIQKEASDE